MFFSYFKYSYYDGVEIEDNNLKINNNYILELYEGYVKSANPNGKILIYIYDYNKDVILKFEEIWEIENNNLKISKSAFFL